MCFVKNGILNYCLLQKKIKLHNIIPILCFKYQGCSREQTLRYRDPDLFFRDFSLETGISRDQDRVGEKNVAVLKLLESKYFRD